MVTFAKILVIMKVFYIVDFKHWNSFLLVENLSSADKKQDKMPFASTLQN